MKTKLNCSSVIIKLSAKEMENLEGTGLSIFVTKMYARLRFKYPNLRFTGTWGAKDNKIFLFCEKMEGVLVA